MTLRHLLQRSDTSGAEWPEYMAQRATAARDPRLQAYFQAWNIPADMPVGEAPLVALDMETTGLDPNRHAIVSIGLVPFTLDRVRFSQRRHWLVRPPRPLDARSVTFHHITHSDIAAAPDLSEVLEEVLTALKGRLAVVHYRNVERPFLNAAVEARIGEGLLFPVIDTMELEARFLRHGFLARLKRYFGRPPASIRLQESRLRYGLPAYQPHQAVIDALATAELLQAQVRSRFTAETPVGRLWC